MNVYVVIQAGVPLRYRLRDVFLMLLFWAVIVYPIWRAVYDPVKGGAIVTVLSGWTLGGCCHWLLACTTDACLWPWEKTEG